MNRKYPLKVRIKTFFYYYKWYLLAAVIVLIGLIPVFKNLFGIGIVVPDYRVACVTAGGISDAAAEELTAAMEALGEDLNGDGTVKVELVQYRTGAGDAETKMYFGYASTITIQADIERGESHFFLMDDPERLQLGYQILADANGKLPEDTDYSADGRYVRWCDVRLHLSEDAQKELSPLYFGQRGYYQEEQIPYLEQYHRLWETLTQ